MGPFLSLFYRYNADLSTCRRSQARGATDACSLRPIVCLEPSLEESAAATSPELFVLTFCHAWRSRVSLNITAEKAIIKIVFGFTPMTDMNENRSEIVSILAEACAQNLTLDLRVNDAKNSENYKSRFLGLDPHAKPPVLTVEAPTARGGVVPVRKGNKAHVIFSQDGKSRSFRTEVLGRGRFELNDKVTVPSLELAAPESLSSGENRNFYRVILSDVSIELAVSIFAEKQGQPRRIRAREKATLTDIGGGGLGFRIPEGKSLLLNPDTRVLLTFRLPGEDEPVRLLGRICFSIRKREQRVAFFGVQFTDLDSDIEYKRNIDRILRFVAELQRRTLRSRIPITKK